VFNLQGVDRETRRILQGLWPRRFEPQIFASRIAGDNPCYQHLFQKTSETAQKTKKTLLNGGVHQRLH
jgi:hypothetical protein